MTVAPVTESNFAAALARLFRGAADPAAASAEFHALLEDGLLLAEDILVAQAGEAVLGTIFAQRLGGAQAAVFLPAADSSDIADALAAAVVAHLARLGQRVLQAVVKIPTPPAMSSLERAGFAPVSDLIFLVRDLVAGDAAVPPVRLKLRPVAIDDLAFAELIHETYIDSRDMPELNDTRSAQETLESCQQSAKVEPPLWWFARFDNQNVGVLQLAPMDREGDFELIYMGLSPPYRRQGFGRELARLALTVVAALGGKRLHLSRDVRNGAAGRVYDQLGFRETNRRAVWLKIPRDSSQLSQPLRNSSGECS